MKNTLSAILPVGYDKVSDLKIVGRTNFLYGGLNIVYGLEGSGKSWQIVASDFGENDVIYIDTDGSNGSEFVNHCNKHNVHYINSDTAIELKKDFVERFNEVYNKNHQHDKLSIIEKVFIFIVSVVHEHKLKHPEQDTFEPVFIMDSFSSMAEGAKINNAEDISHFLYQFNRVADELKICLILIDHATKIDNGPDFKLEGNAGAKKRTTVTVNKYVADDVNKPELGGIFLCERARGNLDGLKVGSTDAVASKKTIDSALEWFKNRHPDALKQKITQTNFTQYTKHARDHWVKDFKNDIFKESKEGNTIYLVINDQVINAIKKLNKK